MEGNIAQYLKGPVKRRTVTQEAIYHKMFFNNSTFFNGFSHRQRSHIDRDIYIIYTTE